MCMRRLTAAAAIGVAMVALAAPVSASELFLKPARPRAEPGTEQLVELINGSFEKSANAIARERMTDVSVASNGQVIHPPASDWHDAGTSAFLKLRTAEPGTYSIGVSTRPSIVTMSAREFAQYLARDGMPDALAAFERDNRQAKVRERYSKHVRAVVQVGDRRTQDFAQSLGYPLEIIPEQNPYELRFGRELGFLVLYRGKPLANQLVRASYEGFHGHDATGEHVTSYPLRTDAAGRATLLLSNKALWYLATIHMQKVADGKADYESNWATLTFSVR